MATQKKVAVAGATGNLGPALVQGLVDKGFSVSVLSRSAKSLSWLPLGAEVVKIDWSDPTSITTAIKNHDAVVSALPPLDENGLGTNHALIDACLAAGVGRFVPSSFGGDLDNERIKKLPAYKGKVEILKRCRELADEGRLEFVDVACGPFFDLSIQIGLFLDPQSHSVTYYNGGAVPFSTTTLESVGNAVAACLLNWEKVKNRIVRIQDAVVTQKQLVDLAKLIQADDARWVVNNQETDALEKKARENYEKGNVTGDDVVAMIKVGVWGKGTGTKFTEVDNEVLGLRELDEEGVGEVVSRYCN